MSHALLYTEMKKERERESEMKSFSPPRLASERERERERERWAGHEKRRYKVERKSEDKKRREM